MTLFAYYLQSPVFFQRVIAQFSPENLQEKQLSSLSWWWRIKTNLSAWDIIALLGDGWQFTYIYIACICVHHTSNCLFVDRRREKMMKVRMLLQARKNNEESIRKFAWIQYECSQCICQYFVVKIASIKLKPNKMSIHLNQLTNSN